MRHAYFPLRGCLVLLATGASGETAHVGMVGADGWVGVPALLDETSWPYVVMAPVPGEANRIRISTLLAACGRDLALRRLLMGHAQLHIRGMTHAAVCLRFHTVLQRLSGWLLAAADVVGSETIDVTQCLLAQVLGTQRSAISAAITVLQDRGVLRQRHGALQILLRRGLRTAACPCLATLVDMRPRESRGQPLRTSV